ncbi:MAG TPA: ABC transporter permease [Actinomycetota bacterium]|nr:ABC transporter permease [Actinomycetota bacterium]
MSKRARRAREATAPTPLPNEDALREGVELAGVEAPQPESITVGPTLGGTDPGGAGAQVTATAGDAPLRQASLWGDAWRQLRRNPLFIIPALLLVLFTLMAFWPSLFANGDPRDCDLSNSILPPSREHLFGFDVQGCDYYTRVIYGTHVSLTIGLITVLFASTIAITLGSISGFYGGKIDAVIARIADIWFAIPITLGAIIILNFLGTRGLFQVSLALMILIWPTMMRLMRSSVLSVKEMDYVAAARALGASDFRILRTHILPNGIAPVIVYATITVGIVIAVEATLSFLGVGLQLPSISWGLMISGAQARILASPHLLFFPAVFLVVLVFTFILLGDALRDALDPRLH